MAAPKYCCSGVVCAVIREVYRVFRLWFSDKNIGLLCHISKNLFNEANYIIRQQFFKDQTWIRYRELNSMLSSSENYQTLPAQTAQQTLKLVDKAWKSFFAAIREWNVHPDKFFDQPRIPRYKRKNGEFILVFTNQQAKLREDGSLQLPKAIGLNLKVPFVDDLREARIIPRGAGYVLEVVYAKIIDIVEGTRERITGIDIGVRNIITMVNNIGEAPVVVKGGVAKSINQFYNKEKARVQSVYDMQRIKYGAKMDRLTVVRERKLSDFMHKTSRFVVNWCVEHHIDTIVIGHNDNWKQNVELGKRNNQTFVQIPFAKLIQQIRYKAEEEGIEVIEQDEAHTSKCSFLDNEPIEHQERYVGKRTGRGMFKTARGIIVNADVNAGYNIIRKAVSKAFAKTEGDGIEGVGLHPVRYNIR